MENNSFFNKLTFNFTKLFSNKQEDSIAKKDSSPIGQINKEIKRNEENLYLKKELKAKYMIRKKILYLLLRKKYLTTQNSYIKKAHQLLNNESEDNLYEALNFLQSLPYERFASSYKNEIYRYKALMYELLEDFNESSKAYKDALKAINDTQTLQEFKEYMERYQELLKWQKHKNDEKIILDELYNIHNSTPLEKLPQTVAMLENIALYYARSPKSRSLGKRYFKEVLKIYKKLFEHNPQEFACDYIRVLLDAIERFMLTTLLLKEAESILDNPTLCIDQKVVLTQKLQEIKQKNFVKKSKIYKGHFNA